MKEETLKEFNQALSELLAKFGATLKIEQRIVVTPIKKMDETEVVTPEVTEVVEDVVAEVAPEEIA